MPRRTALAALAASALALQACASSAPYTGAAAAINTGAALGVGAASRSSGGCWATCTDGLVCNPASGWCEKPKPVVAADCPPGAPVNDLRCKPWPAPTVVQRQPAATPGAVGVSPATGQAPATPAESSPGGPPKP